MPLINLQTNLKSLRYGADRQGGGDSGLPYIRKDISTANPGIKFDDGLVRGGTINAALAGATDTLRIAKFLTDLPKGPLFIAKQVGLQLSNPRLEVRNNPLISSTAGLLQPTRIYNLGLNTLAQIPVNAFGIHFDRHGLLPIQSENTKYESVVRNNAGLTSNNIDVAKSFNRLLRLTDKFKLGNNTTINTNSIVNRYIGGPESVYGIGSTTINRSTYTGYSNNIEAALEASKDYAGYTREEAGKQISYFKDLGTGSDAIYNYDFNFGNISLVAGVDQNVVTYSPPTSANPSLKTYAELKKQIQTSITQSTGAGLTTSGSFVTVDLTTTGGLNRGATGFKYLPKGQYKDVKGIDRNDNNVYPPISFKIIKPFGGEINISLSAYINGFRDSFNGTWNDVNYAGRAESFYIYSKFKREVSFNLQLPCFNKNQLKDNHQKLNTLASITAGQYNGLLLGGVLIQLTVPNYVIGEYATLNSVSYDMPDGATWDIDEKLSTYISAQFSFTIIHKELPQLGSKLITNYDAL